VGTIFKGVLALKKESMKKIVFFVFFTVFAAAFAQQIIDNPKTPKNKDAGRILKLKEEMRIKGEGKDYFLSGARDLQIDKSGNIFICDSWSSSQESHLMKFSPEGRFLKDLYRQGQGPGEIQSLYDFVLDESEVYVYDYMQRKIIVMGTDGRFIKEFKDRSGTFNDFIGVFKDWLVFMRTDRPYERKHSRLYDLKDVIVFVSKDGEMEEDFHTFIRKQFIISLAQGGGMMDWDPFIATMGDDELYVCHASEYLVEVFDLNTKKITTKFRRKYPRVKHEMLRGEKEFIARYNAPKKKFDPDIKELFYNHGYLWVKTSVEDKDKGFLFDVFDSKGQFLDSFFINLDGYIVKIDGDFLYSSESDEEGLPFVVKYRIMESLGS
jgi:hypothetical protein